VDLYTFKVSNDTSNFCYLPLGYPTAEKRRYYFIALSFVSKCDIYHMYNDYRRFLWRL